MQAPAVRQMQALAEHPEAPRIELLAAVANTARGIAAQATAAPESLRARVSCINRLVVTADALAQTLAGARIQVAAVPGIESLAREEANQRVILHVLLCFSLCPQSLLLTNCITCCHQVPLGSHSGWRTCFLTPPAEGSGSAPCGRAGSLRLCLVFRRFILGGPGNLHYNYFFLCWHSGCCYREASIFHQCQSHRFHRMAAGRAS